MTRVNSVALLVVALVFGCISFLVGGIAARGQDAHPTAAPPAAKEKGSPSADHPPAIAAGAKTITVHGLCTDQHSDPIPNARVRVFWMMTDDEPLQLAAEVKTDGDGKFSISGFATLPADPHRRENFTGLVVVATAVKHVSAIQQLDEVAEGWASLVLDNDPGTLSGVVTDDNGKPLKGVTVYQKCCGSEPVPECRSAVTDEHGRYAIADMNRWNALDSAKIDPKTGMATMVWTHYVELAHPQYAKSRGKYTAVPQEVNVKFSPPAIVEGQVIDQVTGQPLANVPVAAQGVARTGSYSTRTDANGNYRLVMNKNYYNIWADADDRIAIAVKTLSVEPGKTIKDVVIPMVRGGFVVGKVFDGVTDKVVQGRPQFVAHYGPARPRTGAAVTFTPIKEDGTYRLRVAPGHNYVYLMDGSASVWIDVVDGQEVNLDLHTGQKVTQQIQAADADVNLASRLTREAIDEEAEEDRIAKGGQPHKPTRNRRDTPTGRLLDRLDVQNAGPARFNDPWLRTLKEIADLGPAAVPELAEELDATNDQMMMRCMAFTLRAIDDKRAVPAPIRKIPKTFLPPGSDMSLHSYDDELAELRKNTV